MGRSQADIAATALVAVLACGAAAAGAPPAAMIVLGIMLLAAPGYLLGRLLVGSRTTGLELVVVMAGLALAVPVLGGLLLYAVGVPLHRPGWLGLLAGVTLAADTALFARRRAAAVGRADRPAMQVQTAPSGLEETGEPRLAPGEPQPAGRASRWHVAVFAVAVLVAAAAVSLAVTGAVRQPQPGFTQLWLSPQQQSVHTLSLGVTNNQGRATSYRLVLRRDGRVINTWNLTLGEGRSWQRTVPFTGKQVLAARLYRLPDLTHPYRHVSVGPSRGTAGP